MYILSTAPIARLYTLHCRNNMSVFCAVSRWNLLMNYVGKQINSVSHKLYLSVYKQCSVCSPLSQKLKNSVEISQSYINLTSSKWKCAVFWATLYIDWPFGPQTCRKWVLSRRLELRRGNSVDRAESCKVCGNNISTRQNQRQWQPRWMVSADVLAALGAHREELAWCIESCHAPTTRAREAYCSCESQMLMKWRVPADKSRFRVIGRPTLVIRIFYTIF